MVASCLQGGDALEELGVWAGQAVVELHLGSALRLAERSLLNPKALFYHPDERLELLKGVDRPCVAEMVFTSMVSSTFRRACVWSSRYLPVWNS